MIRLKSDISDYFLSNAQPGTPVWKLPLCSAGGPPLYWTTSPLSCSSNRDTLAPSELSWGGALRRGPCPHDLGSLGGLARSGVAGGVAGRRRRRRGGQPGPRGCRARPTPCWVPTQQNGGAAVVLPVAELWKRNTANACRIQQQIRIRNRVQKEISISINQKNSNFRFSTNNYLFSTDFVSTNSEEFSTTLIFN